MTYAAIFRLLRVLLPLLKEGLFGKEKVTDVIRKNKATSAWMLAGGICFFAMITFVLDYYELEHLYRKKIDAQSVVKARLKAMELASGILPGDPVPKELYTQAQYDVLMKEIETLQEENKEITCVPDRRPPQRPQPDKGENEQLLQDLRGLW